LRFVFSLPPLASLLVDHGRSTVTLFLHFRCFSESAIGCHRMYCAINMPPRPQPSSICPFGLHGDRGSSLSSGLGSTRPSLARCKPCPLVHFSIPLQRTGCHLSVQSEDRRSNISVVLVPVSFFLLPPVSSSSSSPPLSNQSTSFSFFPSLPSVVLDPPLHSLVPVSYPNSVFCC